MKFKEGGEVSRAESEVKNAEFKTLYFGGACNAMIHEEFPPNLKTQVTSLFLVWSVERGFIGLCVILVQVLVLCLIPFSRSLI